MWVTSLFFPARCANFCIYFLSRVFVNFLRCRRFLSSPLLSFASPLSSEAKPIPTVLDQIFPSSSCSQNLYYLSFSFPSNSLILFLNITSTFLFFFFILMFTAPACRPQFPTQLATPATTTNLSCLPAPDVTEFKSYQLPLSAGP